MTPGAASAGSGLHMSMIMKACCRAVVVLGLLVASGTAAAPEAAVVGFMNASKVDSSTKPSNRADASVVMHGSVLYQFGGRSSGGEELNELWKIDLAPHTKTWAQVEESSTWPSKRMQHSAVMYKTEMVVFGGYADGGSSDLWMFDTVSVVWKKISEGSVNTLYGHTAVMHGSKLVVFGGKTTDSKISDGFYQIDIAATEPKWTIIKPSRAIKGRFLATGGISGSRMYIFGGEVGDANELSNSIEMIDLAAETPTWKPLAPQGTLPNARAGMGGAMFGSMLMIFGGYEENQVRNDMWKIDVSLEDMELSWTLVWENFATPTTTVNNHTHPPPCSNMKMAVFGNRVFFFGGQSASETLGDLWGLPVYHWQRVSAERAYKYEGECESNTKMIALYEGDGYGGTANTGRTFREQEQICAEACSVVPKYTQFAQQFTPQSYNVKIGAGEHGQCVCTKESTSECTKISTPGTWTYDLNSMPIGRSSGTAQMVGDELVLFAGVDEKGTSLDDVWKIDLSSSAPSWYQVTSSSDRPTARSQHVAVSHNNKLFVFGGKDTDTWRNDLWELTLGTSSPGWTEVRPSGNLPNARLASSAVLYGTKLVLFGGQDQYNCLYDDVWTIDLSNPSSWNKLEISGSCTARSHHSAVMNGTVMIVFGGKISDSSYLNDVIQLDLTTNTWTANNGYGTRPTRYGHSAYMYNGDMYIFGGATASTAAATNDLYRFDGTGWAHLSLETGASSLTMPSTRILHMGAAYGAKWVVTGGKQSPTAFTVYNDLWVLDVGSALCISASVCPAGKYVSSPSSCTTDVVCTSCPADMFSNAPDSSECTHWTVCEAGTRISQHAKSTADRQCTDCAAGKYQGSSLQSSCVDCEAGKYTTQTGQTFCQATGNGEYQDETGQTNAKSCAQCAAGKELNDCGGSSSGSCTECSIGRFNDVTGGTCSNCPGNLPNTFPYTSCKPGQPLFQPSETAFANVIDNEQRKISITLKWKSPTSNGGSPITSYEYQHVQNSGTTSECGGSNENTTWQMSNSNTSLTVIVDFESSHTFLVRAKNANGEGPNSDPLPILAPGDSSSLLVDGDAGNDISCDPCKTMQGAFLHATVTGQTISVRPGLYDGSGLVPRAGGIQIQAVNSTTGVTLDCRGSRCFSTNSTGKGQHFFPTLIDGLRIINGNAEMGGCMFIEKVVSSITMKNLHFENCTASTWGGAVHASRSLEVVLSNVAFVANSASEGGGALSMSATSGSIITSNFTHNQAPRGGGMAMIPVSYGQDVDDSTEDRLAKAYITLDRTNFVENYAKRFQDVGSRASGASENCDGGGVFVHSGDITMIGCSLASNTAQRYGGGMFVESSRITMKATQLNRNEIARPGGNGGGLGCLASTMVLEGISVTHNHAGGNGGGGWFTFCSPRILSSAWKENTAGGKGAGLYFGMMSFPKFPAKIPSQPKTTITHNVANKNGGGICCQQCSGLDMADVELKSNKAKAGVGGCLSVESTVHSSVKNAFFADCQASAGGGAISLFDSAAMTLKNTDFYRNAATSGGGGGILWGFEPDTMKTLTDAQVPVNTLDNCAQENNTAAYGPFIASTIHSMFMMDGPTVERGPALTMSGSGSTPLHRISQTSSADDWVSIDGGRSLRRQNGRVLRVGFYDWYNRLVSSSNRPIGLTLQDNVEHAELSGPSEVACVGGIATFEEFMVIGRPQTSVVFDFYSDDTSLVRGPRAQVEVRSCRKGEYYDSEGKDQGCLKCGTGMYGDGLGVNGTGGCKSCATGKYQDRLGQIVCNACRAGQYQDLPGQFGCVMCSLGKASDVGATSCDACPPGKYDEGGGECIMCPKGTYSDLNESVVCKTCENGKYNGREGATNCSICEAGKTSIAGAPVDGTPTIVSCTEDCPAGRYKPKLLFSWACEECLPGQYSGIGQETCSSCAPGKYSGRAAEACVKCRVGKHASTQNAAACTYCPSGKFAPQEGLAECEQCPEQTYISAADVQRQVDDDKALTACNICDKGKWTEDKRGQSTCVDCKVGEEFDEGSRRCQICDDGFYSFHNIVGLECTPCPVGAECRGGALRIKRGFWVSGGGLQEDANTCDNSTVETCSHKFVLSDGKYTKTKKDPDDCKDEQGKSHGVYYDACSMKRKISVCGMQPNIDPECVKYPQSMPCLACFDNHAALPSNATNRTRRWNVCNEKEGYSGRLCQSCLPGFARDSSNPLRCQKCLGEGVSWFFIGLGVAIAVGFLTMFVGSNMRSAGSSDIAGATQKILLNYLQTVSIAASFPLKWPPIMTGLFAAQSSASTFSDQLMNFDCEMAKQAQRMNIFWQKQIFYVMLPAVLLMCNVLYWFVLKDRIGCKCCGCRERVAKILKNIVPEDVQKLAGRRRGDSNVSKTMSKLEKDKLKHLSRKVVHHSRTTREGAKDVFASVSARTHHDKRHTRISDDIAAYKAAMEARGDGTAVILARALMDFIHEKNIDIKQFVADHADDHFKPDQALVNHYITQRHFVEVMEKLEVPLSREELVQVAHLLDDDGNDRITVHEMVSFYRTSTDKIILSSTIIMFILYPTLCKNVFKLFACKPGLTPSVVGGYPSTFPMYILSDLELQCWDSTHVTIVLLVGVPSIVLYILGFPLLSIFALKQNSGDKMSDQAMYRYSMFLNGYRPETFFWECIIALRKASVTFVSVFFSQQGVFTQTYVGIIALFVFLSAHVLCRPFATDTLNKLETTALGTAFVTLYLGMIFFVGIGDGGNADAVFIALSVFLLFLNVSFMFWAFKLAFQTFLSGMVMEMVGMDLETLMQHLSCCCFRSRSKKLKNLASVVPIKKDGENAVDDSHKRRAEVFWEGGEKN
jgi:N-acetylneuraminic acid mutarotase